MLALGVAGIAAETRDKQHEKLRLVGSWNTEHTLPTGDGDPTVVRGEASFEWVPSCQPQ